MIGRNTFFLSLIASLVTYALQPADAKPILSIKNSVFEGSVDIDNRLKAYPKLYAFLLAHGRRALARAMVRPTDEDAKQLIFEPGGRRWKFTNDATYTLRAVTGPYVSVIRITDWYGGGAHPNYGLTTWFWDRTSERQATLADMLIDAEDDGPTMKKLAELVSTGIDKENERRGNSSDPVVLEAKLKGLAPTFAPSTIPGKASGLIFYFPPYEVGSYADGFYIIFVPAAAVAPLFKPSLQNLFAGQRPKSDAPAMGSADLIGEPVAKALSQMVRAPTSSNDYNGGTKKVMVWDYKNPRPLFPLSCSETLIVENGLVEEYSRSGQC